MFYPTFRLPSVFALTSLFIGSAALAQESWSSYRGPNGDGTTKAAVASHWSSNGPKMAWKSPATKGFSSVTVAEGVACSLITRDSDGVAMETCVAWDAKSGKELWATPMKPAKYDGGGDSGTKDNGGGDGPRSTPTIVGGRVFAYGLNFDIFCFEAKSGKILWQHSMMDEFGGKKIQWQNASSPVVVGTTCIVGGGGDGQAFVGFEVGKGDVVWKSGSETMTHATPTVATLHGETQVIFFTKAGLTSVSPKDGKQLWHQNFPFKTSTAASPVVWQDIVYCSAGYGVGGGAYKISKKGADYSSEEIWRTEGKNANHWSTPVVKDGYLYGMFSFKEYGNGPVACVDIRTGDEKWKQPGFGAGNLILAGNDLLALSDSGELVVFDASPNGYKEKGRSDVLDGKCWSTPTLAGGFIFARSTKEAGCWSAK